MKRISGFLGLILGLSLLVPQVMFAQTATTSTAAQLMATITALDQQIASLKAQLDSLQQQTQDIKEQLARTLSMGAQGDDVKTIQVLLASDPTLYPEGMVTGYFGVLTSKAIKRFQERYGIEAVGFVGPKTLKKINELLAEGLLVVTAPQNASSTPTISVNFSYAPTATSTIVAVTPDCLVTPPGHFIAPGYLKKHNSDREENDGEEGGDEHGHHGDGDKKENEHEGRPFSIPCNFLPPVTDTTAPVISNVSVSGISTSSATINWTTNESAYGELAYGTSTNYSAGTPWSTGSAMSFSQPLSGLTASTTYHYQIGVKDLSGNIATSSDFIFTTATVPADTTPPAISSVATGNVASTTASVIWTTDEVATSKVYYGTSTPLVLGTALTGSNSLLVTTHVMPLSGLTASSTYHYVVQSQDGAGNTATSTENSFMTLP